MLNFVNNSIACQSFAQPWVHAECFIMRVTPFGTERDLTRSIAAKTDRVFLVFQGQVHADQSSWRVGVDALWSKALYRLRLSHHESAVIAIAAKPVCKAERFPWSELREL